MVRSTKRCLRKAIGSRRLTYEELNTVLIEVEAVLNSRPITYIYENDIEEPLTPSHLFCGRRLLSNVHHTESGDILEDESFEMRREDAVSKLKAESSVIEHFWSRWYREYLIDLRESHKMSQPKDKPSIAVGDVVLVEEDGVKRNNWKLGRIVELVVGRDGVVRGAQLKTTTEKGSTGMISRPLQKLYPLEVRDDPMLSHDDDDSAENVSMNDTDGPSSVPTILVPTSQLSPNSKNESTPLGVDILSKNMSNTPLPSSSQSRRATGHSMVEGVQTSEGVKTYGSTTTRPRRKAGEVGEQQRRTVERKIAQRGDDVE